MPVHCLVPEPLRNVQSVDNFMAELPKYDDNMTASLQEAEAAGECLRYVGMFLSPMSLLHSKETRFESAHVDQKQDSSQVLHLTRCRLGACSI